MTREELEEIVIRFMDSFTTMTLACCVEKTPWTAAVYYARQGFDLIFFSSPRSRHSLAFAANPAAAAAIHGDYRLWQEIKGLQMQGRVEPITSPLALAKATTTYLKKYPFVREFLSDPAAISPTVLKKMAKVSLYVFRPDSIGYVNNEAGFGTRWKLDIEDGAVVGDPVLA